MGFHFMNIQTFDQVNLPKVLSNAPTFLKEGENVDVLFHADEERALSCDLPQFVILEVVYAEPGVKGDTANNVTKPATLETGTKINVPIFVNQGQKIRIDTKTGAYVERVKS